MQSKLKFISILLAATFFIFSCSKNDSIPVTVQPELFDTLGAGWQRIKVNDINFNDIFFVDNQSGYLCGDKYVGKSTDGGISWQQLVPDSLKDGFINLYFTDQKNGWVLGGYYSLRTKDGGTSWQKLNMVNIYDGQFFDANNGYVTSRSGTTPGLYKTSDGGATFQATKFTSSGVATALFFLNQNKGWFANNLLNITENGGTSFLTFTLSGGNNLLYAIQFTDALHGWMAGGRTVYKTIDGGVTLTPIAYSDAIGSDIQFFDNNNGFILSGGKIYSTTDGGKTLNQLCAIHKSYLQEIHFTDLNHGWTAGSGGYVYKYIKP